MSPTITTKSRMETVIPVIRPKEYGLLFESRPRSGLRRVLT